METMFVGSFSHGQWSPTQKLSWSVLGHVLSEEQSKDGSDGVSDDGRLTIVQCHHYHRPPLSDLYRSSNISPTKVAGGNGGTEQW